MHVRAGPLHIPYMPHATKALLSFACFNLLVRLKTNSELTMDGTSKNKSTLGYSKSVLLRCSGIIHPQSSW
jgi:hypothetical protein